MCLTALTIVSAVVTVAASATGIGLQVQQGKEQKAAAEADKSRQTKQILKQTQAAMAKKRAAQLKNEAQLKKNMMAAYGAVAVNLVAMDNTKAMAKETNFNNAQKGYC